MVTEQGVASGAGGRQDSPASPSHGRSYRPGNFGLDAAVAQGLFDKAAFPDKVWLFRKVLYGTAAAGGVMTAHGFDPVRRRLFDHRLLGAPVHDFRPDDFPGQGPGHVDRPGLRLGNAVAAVTKRGDFNLSLAHGRAITPSRSLGKS